MSQGFVFGQTKQIYAPTLVYVNQNALSQEMYQRLCSNPTQAIMLFDKHHDRHKNASKLSSIYTGFDIQTYGISTMFNNNPSLSQCQTIWTQQLLNLKQQSINNSSVIIIESNPNKTEKDVKHSLGRLLPIQYRQDLQSQIDKLQNELIKLDITNNDESIPKTVPKTVPKPQITIINNNNDDEDDTDPHLTPDTDIDSDREQNTLNTLPNSIINGNDTPKASGSGSNEDVLCDLMENEDVSSSDIDDIGNSLLIFSGFDYYSIETMRQFVMVAQYIETQCLAVAVTKYTFLSRKDQSVAILFESQTDAQLIKTQLNGMVIDDVTERLIVKYAKMELTNKIKKLFKEIDEKKNKYLEELQRKRQQRMEEKRLLEAKQSENGNDNKNKEENGKDTIIEIVEEKQNDNKPFIFGVKNEEKQNDIKPFIFGVKNEEKATKKKKFVPSMTLKKGVMNIVNTMSNAVVKVLANIDKNDDDEMIFDIDKDKILGFFGQDEMGKYIKRMCVEEEIHVWQYKDVKKSQWIDVDMMLSLYLNILPFNEKVMINTNKSGLKFNLIRTSQSNAILMYNLLNIGNNNNNNKSIEYKLNRISKCIKNGVYIPIYWERELLNRSLNKTYLYSIGLNVFELFGKDKYRIWYPYLSGYVENGKIESISSIENWINYHSFNFYSNWKCATKNGYKVIRLWYLESGNNNNNKGNVLKNGFMGKGKNGWIFYANLESAIKLNGKNKIILLCQVCIDEKNEMELQRNNGNGSCVLTTSLCGYPELCVRLK